MAGGRYIALTRVDEVYQLPPGVAEVWARTGLVQRQWFVDHGVIVQGFRREEVTRVVARERARAIQRARAGPDGPTVC